MRLSNLGIQQRDWESPGNLTLKVNGIWLQNFHRTGGSRDFWKAQTKPCVHQDPGERSSDSPGNGARPACGCLKFSCRGLDRQCPAVGTRAPAAAVLGAACWHKSFRGSPVALLWSLDSRTGSLQARQLTEREHSPTDQQTIGLKISWAWPCPLSKTQFIPWPDPPVRKLARTSYPYPSQGGCKNYKKKQKL